MLTDKTTKKLKKYGFDVEKLIEAIKADGEVEFTPPEINNLSTADLEARDANVISQARTAIFKEGKDAGIEIANKAVASKFNLEIDDHKDVNKIIEALNSTVAKGDAGLKEQIVLLQKAKADADIRVTETEGRAKQLQFDTDLITHFPSNRTGMTDKDYLLLIKSNYEFEEVDGKIAIKKDGQIMRDANSQAPLAVKDVIPTIFNERKWIGQQQQQGGRGGNDSQNNQQSANTYKSAVENFKKEFPDKSAISPEAMAYVNKIAGEVGADFDWNVI